jgi:hypothetical protein
MARDERTIIAYHEAGHAIMAWASGFVVKEVSVIPTEEAGGQVRFEHPTLSDPIDLVLCNSLIMTDLGGIAGDQILWSLQLDKQEGEAICGDGRDQMSARGRLARIDRSDDADFSTYLAIATLFLNGPNVWPIVVEVAAALLSRGVLSASEIDQFANRIPRFDTAFWYKLDYFHEVRHQALSTV